MANFDYLMSSKNTLAGRYFYTNNPQDLTLGGELPGAPSLLDSRTPTRYLKLTTLVTNTVVERSPHIVSAQPEHRKCRSASRSHQRSIGHYSDDSRRDQAARNYFDCRWLHHVGRLWPNLQRNEPTEVSDQISWSHGKHTIRAGYEFQDTRWPIIWSGVRGLLLTGTLNDLLVGGAGNLLSCLYCSRSAPEGIVHGFASPSMNAYVRTISRSVPN